MRDFKNIIKKQKHGFFLDSLLVFEVLLNCFFWGGGSRLWLVCPIPHVIFSWNYELWTRNWLQRHALALSLSLSRTHAQIVSPVLHFAFYLVGLFDCSVDESIVSRHALALDV